MLRLMLCKYIVFSCSNIRYKVTPEGHFENLELDWLSFSFISFLIAPGKEERRKRR